MAMSEPKDVEVKARVSWKTRVQMKELADDRGESMSLIVREAVREYLAKRTGHQDTAIKKRSSG